MKLLFSVVFISASYLGHNTVLKRNANTEIFIQKLDRVNCNRLVVNDANLVANGVFYGVDQSNSTRTLYYKANLVNIFNKDDKFDFELKNYVFSLEPFRIGDVSFHPKTVKDTDIPGDFFSSIYYFGNRKGDTLVLQRITATYHNKADQVIFVREKLETP